MARLVFVEDDVEILRELSRRLEHAGHAVRPSRTAFHGLRDITDWSPDLVILDLGLPDLDGVDVLRMIRSVSKVPVIVATARDDEIEIVRILRAGADDYLVKPFMADHLCARIEALLRRVPTGQVDSPIVVNGLVIHVRGREATLDGAPLDLTRREFDLLAYLGARVNAVVSRQELMTEVWGMAFGEVHTVDVHMSWLRRKLSETAARPRYIHTVRGVGFKLTSPPTAD